MTKNDRGQIFIFGILKLPAEMLVRQKRPELFHEAFWGTPVDETSFPGYVDCNGKSTGR